MTVSKLLRGSASVATIALLIGFLPASAQADNGPLEVRSHIAPNGTVTTKTPREDGSFRMTVQDARGVTTEFDYSANGNLLEKFAPEQGATRYQLDADGRVERILLEDGVAARISYDEKGRKKRETIRQNGQERIITRFIYDTCENGEGRLCRVRHDNHTNNYSYDIEGRMTKSSIRFEGEDTVETVRYRYFDDGQLRSMRYPSGLLVRYHYNDDDILSKITGRYETGDGRETFTIADKITIDSEVGALTGFTHGNGLRTNISRSESGRLDSLLLSEGQETVDWRVFQYNTDGQIETIDRPGAEHDRTFGYEYGRLTREVIGDGTPSGSSITDYVLDAVGNRTQRTRDGRKKSYEYAPDSNRLIAIGRNALNYDARGNLIEDRAGKRRFSYDATNRMQAFFKNDELIATYDYDMQGRRIRKLLSRPSSDGAKSVRFHYDAAGLLVSETIRREDQSSVKARDIVWLGGMPIAQIDRRVNADGAIRKASVLFLTTDHLGAPREARDQSGTVVWRWSESAFGDGQVNRDPDRDGNNIEVSLRFPGQYHDRESGLFRTYVAGAPTQSH